MELDLLNLLKAHPVMGLYVVIASGFLIGRIGPREYKLGAPIGVLATALLFGHFGVTVPPAVGLVGFVFFIYSVGYQAGPRFFASFREDGLRYMQIAFVIAITSVAVALAFEWIFGWGPGLAAGALAGGLTSTPTLAAAQDAVTSGLVEIPDGQTPESLKANIAVSYALTYVFGMIGVILVIRVLPRLFGVDIVKACRKAEKESSTVTDVDDELGLAGREPPMWRTFRVSRARAIGRSLETLSFIRATRGGVVTNVFRGDESVEVGPETTLRKDDIVKVLGSRGSQILAASLLGPETVDARCDEDPLETRQVLLLSPELEGRTLREAQIMRDFGSMVVRILRSSISIPIAPDTVLRRGDYLLLTGPRKALESAAERLGRSTTPLDETDLFVFSIGIALGLLVGVSTIQIGDLPIGIGAAGGLLLAGLIVGRLRLTHPGFGRVPRPARYLLRELGILLFMAAIGLQAGPSFVSGLSGSGFSLIFGGAAITLIPPVVAFLYGRHVLSMPAPTLMGAITGGMTSTSALGALTRWTKSEVPAVGYAGVYAFGNIVLTVAGQIMMLISVD